MNIPANLKYAETHEWIRVEEQIAYVGISEFAVSELGDISFIDIDTEGEDLDKGEMFGAIEAVKTVSDVYMPISGKVLEVNQAVIDKPELLNNDCYGEGWLIKIEIKDNSEINTLLDSEAYAEIAKH
ncbi:MAG: glycine cleavage system protein GcvH [Bacteroidales bacterium]|jgi:glycine cleavage system H protein|nr:glycine cleavage system protein GcvH [Bacteroidales bacterium]